MCQSARCRRFSATASLHPLGTCATVVRPSVYRSRILWSRSFQSVFLFPSINVVQRPFIIMLATAANGIARLHQALAIVAVVIAINNNSVEKRQWNLVPSWSTRRTCSPGPPRKRQKCFPSVFFNSLNCIRCCLYLFVHSCSTVSCSFRFYFLSLKRHSSIFIITVIVHNYFNNSIESNFDEVVKIVRMCR